MTPLESSQYYLPERRKSDILQRHLIKGPSVNGVALLSPPLLRFMKRASHTNGPGQRPAEPEIKTAILALNYGMGVVAPRSALMERSCTGGNSCPFCRGTRPANFKGKGFMRERTKKTTALDDAQDNPQEPQSADTPPPTEREPEKVAEAHTSERLPEPGSDGDIFKHPELLRLNMSDLQKPVAKKLLTTVPIRKPNKQDFIRVHPDENYRFLASLIELKDEREIYFLDPRFAPELDPSEFYFATLHLCVTVNGYGSSGR